MYKIYKVEAGDTLESIARKFGTTEDTLRRINGFGDSDLIRDNQYIIVPVKRGSLFDLYVVQPGDSMYQIAKKYDVDVDKLLKLNGIDKDEYIYPNEEILVPRKDVNFYITKEGDTLASAAEILETNPAALLFQNETIYLLPDQLLVYKKEENIASND